MWIIKLIRDRFLWLQKFFFQFWVFNDVLSWIGCVIGQNSWGWGCRSFSSLLSSASLSPVYTMFISSCDWRTGPVAMLLRLVGVTGVVLLSGEVSVSPIVVFGGEYVGTLAVCLFCGGSSSSDESRKCRFVVSL